MFARTIPARLFAAALVLSLLLQILAPFATIHANAPEPPPHPAAKPGKRGGSKLHGRLQAIAHAYARGGVAAAAAAAGPGAPSSAHPAGSDMLRVVLEAEPGQQADAETAVVNAGGAVEGRSGDLVQVVVPYAALSALDRTASVRSLRPPYFWQADVTSEGWARTGVHQWGQTGSGSKVAIVDAGFQGYQSLLGSELPASVEVRCFCNGSASSDPAAVASFTSHGAGVAEIVHDMAPGAQLYLIRFVTELDLSNAVDFLLAQGVHVVNHSIAWLNAGAGDGAGPINDIVARATAGGIVWVNAAGNYADTYWEGTWSDPNTNNLHNFQGDDETNSLTLFAGQCVDVLLSWNDWPGSDQDFDLYLYNSAMAEVAYSEGSQNGPQEPTEWLFYCAPTAGQYHIRIQRFAATQTAAFRLFTLDTTPEYFTAAGSIITPADSPNVIAVGAVEHDENTIEYFSSRGPTQDGRTKPDLVGPDGVSTVTYGPSGFYGTSASVPHVVGAAALARAQFTSLSPTGVKTWLERTATDMGTKGKDNVYGAGMVTFGNLHGTLDPAFGDVGLVTTNFGNGSDVVNALALRDGARAVAAGYASGVSTTDFALASYATGSGALDTSFAGTGKVTTDFNSGDDVASAVAVQPDGKIAAAGYATVAGARQFALARYLTSGALDLAFGSGGKVLTPFGDAGMARALALQPDGKIVVAGMAVTGDNTDFALARYTAGGVLDPAFGSGGKVTTDFAGNDVANALALYPDGSLVAVGRAGDASAADFALARYTAGGVLAPGFGTGGKVTGDHSGAADVWQAVALQPDGQIVAGGLATNGATQRMALARYTATGVPDGGFGTGGLATATIGGDATATAVAVQADGKILAAGVAFIGVDNDFALARFTTGGTLDTGFGVGGMATLDPGGNSNTANALAVQPDGKVLVGGYGWNGSDNVFAVARYLAGTPGQLAFTVPSLATPESQQAEVFVRRTGGSDGTVSVRVSSTAGGTATAGTDYTVIATTLTWAAGDTTDKSAILPVVNDTADEPDETVALALDNVTGGATIGLMNTATLTITDDDAASRLLTVQKHGAGGGTVTSIPGGVTCGAVCTASFAVGTPVSLTAAAAGGSQFAGWSGGGCSGTGACHVTMNSPITVTATFNLAPASAGTLQFSAAAASAAENASTATITVTRTGGSAGAVGVTAATTTGGTATAGADYTHTSVTLSWANGDTAAKTLTVPLLNDALYEGSETINLALTTATGGATLGTLKNVVMTITEDDAPGSPYAVDVLLDNPAGYWRLGESSGAVAADISGNGNSGTYQNGVTLNAVGALSAEASNTAAQFDGVNDTVTIADAISLSPTAALSVEAWVKLASYAGSYPRLISKDGAYEVTLYTAPGTEGRLEWKVTLAGGAVAVTTAYADRLLVGQWYHVAATYDGSNLRIFINGMQKGSKAATGALRNTSTPLTISRSDRPLAATVDEVAVYGSALSAARVLAHYEVVHPPVPDTPYAAAVMSDSPAAYWRLNETSGVTASDSVGSNHASYLNSPMLGIAHAMPDDASNTAVTLDGVNDVIAAPDSPSLSPTAAVSVEAWVKLTSYAGSYPRILSKDGSYELTLLTVPGTEGRLEWKVTLAGGAVGVTTAYADRLLLGQWYHVVASYDGSNLRVYLNGVQKAIKPATGTVKDVGSAFTISRSDRPLAATVDEVAVYGTALSASRVQAHYGLGAPPALQCAAVVQADAPAGCWRLNESSGTTAADLSGNGNTGTYTNGVVQGVAGALTTATDAAAQFDGVNDFVQVNDSTSLSPTATVSVEAWVNLTSYAGSYPRLVSKDGSYEVTLYTVPGNEGRLEWKVSMASGSVVAVTTAYADRLLVGHWYHVVATYDGADLRIYINGVQKAVKPATGAVKDLSSAFTISRGDRAVAAKLDEVAVYGTALSLARVQAHYAAR